MKYDDIVAVTKLDEDPFEFLDNMLETFMSGAIDAKMKLRTNKKVNAKAGRRVSKLITHNKRAQMDLHKSHMQDFLFQKGYNP